MTSRSIPPASDIFAEMPVPAPPPTIGLPSATLARSLSRTAWRGNMNALVSECDRVLVPTLCVGTRVPTLYVVVPRPPYHTPATGKTQPAASEAQAHASGDLARRGNLGHGGGDESMVTRYQFQ